MARHTKRTCTQPRTTAFTNDTTPRFDEEAAGLAWQRSLDFFAKHLR